MGTKSGLRLNLRALLGSSTPDRWWDVPAALLLLAALLTTASRLVVTEWTEHLDIVQTLTLLGALAGLALGQSLFSPRRATVFALAYGLFAVPWRLGLTLTYLSEDALWIDRLLNLIIRLINSFVQLARQEPVPDPLLFVFCMAILAWVLGVHAGYTLTRYAHPWRAILPAGLALLVFQTYDPLFASRIWFLATYLFFILLLLARLIYLRRRAHWQRKRVFLPAYVGMDLTRVTVQITVLLVLVSWTVPALATAFSPARSAWRDVTRPWISIRDRLENAVASLRDQVGGVYNVYGDTFALGRGDELTDDIGLVVEVQPNSPEPSRYYWRARVYDHYADGQWSTSIVSTTHRVTPQRFGLTFPEEVQSGDRWMGVFTITTAAPISTLYIPAQPVWVSHSAQADLAYNPDGTADLVALHANPPLRAGGTYRVRSSFGNVTVAQLRSAGTDYPSWVTTRYLQLPFDITRIRELARQITFDMNDPYDMAAAITTYLRTYIRYSEVLSPRPSAEQDPVEWFLFDAREGFCSYYASAEVIMLRSLGIPARMAVGYAEGERESGSDIYMKSERGTSIWPEDSELYIVRGRDAHAWPEVYFPGVGWVEFEPTASQPPLNRPLGDDEFGGTADSSLFPGLDPDQRDLWEDRMEEIEIPVESSSPSESPTAALFSGPVMVVSTLVLGLGLGLILIALIWRKQRPRDLPPFPVLLERGLLRFDLQPPAILSRWVLYATLPLLARAYMEINYALTRLGAPPDPADTPAERTMALGHLLPEAANPAQRLLAEYHAMAYSPHLGDLYVAQQAGRDIRSLSWRAAIRRLLASDARTLSWRGVVRLLTTRG